MKKLTAKQIRRNQLRNERKRERRQQRKRKMMLMNYPLFSLSIQCYKGGLPYSQCQYSRSRGQCKCKPKIGKLDPFSKIKSVEKLASVLGLKAPVCACCGKTEGKMSLDHYIPQSKGGTYELWNLQILCQSCNSIKGDSVPYAAQLDISVREAVEKIIKRK